MTTATTAVNRKEQSQHVEFKKRLKVTLIILLIFGLLIGIFLWWYFHRPEEEVIQEVTTDKTIEHIENELEAIKGYMNTQLASMGFESTIPITATFTYVNGRPYYTCETTYGNLKYGSFQPSTDKNIFQTPVDKVIIGNESFPDVKSWNTQNRLNQCAIDMDCVYIIYNTKNTLFYVDVGTNTVYNTQYYAPLHRYVTTKKTGGIYDQYAHI